MSARYRSDEERITRNITRAENGCWIWTRSRNTKGYGRIGGADGRIYLAHRLAYETFIGPIPDGLGLDHLCRNRGCVNPEHLEPVTQAENLRRSPLLNPTHCKHNHEFTEANTYVIPSTGGRMCRTCARERSPRTNRAYRARLRQALARAS